MPSTATIPPIDHKHYLNVALSCARNSPPQPTNFRVGACIVSPSSYPPLLVTGYTLECPGNTHAEQCCFIKLAQKHGLSDQDSLASASYLPEDAILVTTMEPCNKRSVGNMPCVDRILELKREDGRQAIGMIVVGVSEPETFVGVNEGRKRLQDAGIEVIHIGGLEEEILDVATAGHRADEEKH